MVGRPERELQDDGTPLVRLAADLRELRRAAGSPSYRELAKRAHRSQTTLSEAAGGERLPTWDTVQSYVEACGGEVDGWLPRWEAASGRAAGPVPAEAPDPGPEPPTGGAGGAPVVEAPPPRRERAWPAAVVAGLLLGLLVGYALGSSGDDGGGAAAAGRAATQTVTSSSSPSESPSESPSPSLAVRDGSDPEDTGCARMPGVVTLDTTEVDLDGRPVGLAQLKYSPACGAAWPRFETFTDDAVPAGVVVHTDVVRPAPDGGEPEEVFPFSAEHVVDQPTFGNLAVSTSGCVYAAVRLTTDAGETVDSKTHCFRGATYVR